MGETNSVIDREVAHFGKLAAEWWDPRGSMKPLHRMNPCRLGFIRDAAIRHFALTAGGMRPLAGLSVLDIGCGGGILCEPLARLGGAVTGIDPSADCIGAAQAHAAESGLAIDYRAVRVEDLLPMPERFDIVTALEVVEHTADVADFVGKACGMVKPGGLAFFSTINRTLRSFALAIVGAEYILRWLPVGTHDWQKFVRPEELRAALRRSEFMATEESGMIFDPLSGDWRLAGDLAVNYILAAVRP
jgi:2-polyprenyl-6-hydroxyphenyl methylase/3-demethylubiquinone-9 3-methyltransferase